MRPYVIIVNLAAMAWFIALQVFRFRDEGRACSGDFLTLKDLPQNYDTVYLGAEGAWILYYVISHYIVFGI